MRFHSSGARTTADLLPPVAWLPTHVRRDPLGRFYYLDPRFHPLTFAEWRELRNVGGTPPSLPRSAYLRLRKGEMVLVGGVMLQGDPSGRGRHHRD